MSVSAVNRLEANIKTPNPDYGHQCTYEDGVGFIGGANRLLQGPATHGTFGSPQSLRLNMRCPHCHKVTSVGPAFARTHWIGYTVFAIVAIIVAVSVTAGQLKLLKQTMHCTSFGQEDGVGFIGGANRLLQGPATHGTFGSPQSLRLTCGNCNSPFSIPSPESQSFGRTHAFTAFLSARGASNAAGLITARCPHCHKVTSVGPAFARTHWIGYTVFAIVAIIVAVSVTAGTAEAAKTNNALYFLWSILYLVALVLMSRAVVFMIMPVSSVEVPTLQI
ncbi:hypothetical protein MN116_008930 [Schistosoma mekongi]|uniref:Phosphatidylinositol-4,5-bisphosphate 4-phosphatase n=1 Tax=Schistosoma mekongi TaxID=38744 RepID=A0AAE2D145_SCHME|nr:hypothetical protein MN116_008930 [Schistosoma mekongi]